LKEVTNMQTLHKATIIRWVSNLVKIEAALGAVAELAMSSPAEWVALKYAKIDAERMRNDLLDLSVAPVAVEVWDRESV
jgi:hypothetical protein